jgi:hypothetical protein
MAAYGGSDCEETAKCILLVDRIFDCLNTRSMQESIKKRKTDLKEKDVH